MNSETLNLAAFAENPDNPSTASDDAIARLMKKLRMMIYWLAAATLTACVTYTGGKA